MAEGWKEIYFIVEKFEENDMFGIAAVRGERWRLKLSEKR